MNRIVTFSVIFLFIGVNLGKAQTAEDIFDAENKLRVEKDSLKKADLFWILSEYYKDLDSTLSVYYLKKEFEFATKLKDYQGIALYHSSMMIRYSQSGRHKAAIQQSMLAQKYALLGKDTMAYLDAVDGQLRSLYSDNQYDRLLSIGKSNLDKIHGNQYELRLGKIYMNMAIVYAEQLSPLALQYFNKAQQLIGKTKNNKFMLQVYVNFSKYFNSIGKTDSAIVYARKAVEFSEYNYPNEISYVNAATVLSILLQSNGQYKEANMLNKSIAKTTLAMRFKELAFLKKSTQITLLKEKEKKELVKKAILFFCIGILAIALLIGIWIFQRNQRKRKLLMHSNEKLKMSLKHNQDLLKELNHRVRNNMQIVLGLLYLQSENAGSMSTQDLIQLVTSRIEAISKINEHLHHQTNLSKLEVKAYFDWLIRSIIQNFNINNKAIQFLSSGNEKEIDVDKLFPLGLIINELVINSMKHAFINRESGFIEISYEQKEAYFLLHYKDNGIGYDGSSASGNSLGMKLVHVFVQQLEGIFNIHPSNNGFWATISFAQE